MNIIIQTIKNIHPQHRLIDADVSGHTKSAQAITREWQQAVQGKATKIEVPVSPHNNEKIDVVDFSEMTAYELKVSGKNTHHEFYKDVAKVLTFNEYQSETARIKKLVFISEGFGIVSLKNRLDVKYLNLLLTKHSLSVELVSI